MRWNVSDTHAWNMEQKLRDEVHELLVSSLCSFVIHEL